MIYKFFVGMIVLFSFTMCTLINPDKENKTRDTTLLGLILYTNKPASSTSTNCKNYPSNYSVTGTALSILSLATGNSTCNFDSTSKKLNCTGVNVEEKTFASVSDFINDLPQTYSYTTTGYTGVFVYTYDSLKRKTKQVYTSSDNYTNTTNFTNWDSFGRVLAATSTFTGCNQRVTSYAYGDNKEVMTVTENGGGSGCLSGVWTNTKTFDSNKNIINQTLGGIVTAQANFIINSTTKVCE